MLSLKRLALILCLLITYQTLNSQPAFSNEIGIVLGPVQFRSDFGVRNNQDTNIGNSGFGIGIVHYMDFFYRSFYSYTYQDNYFKDHFKLRTEISYNESNLEHLGQWVDASKTSENAKRLRGHKGVGKNLDFGSQLEFFPLSIHAFQASTFRISPYLSAGIHYTLFFPEASTSYENPDPTAIGDINNVSNFFSGWEPGSIDPSRGGTFSLVTSVGFRYKINVMSDIVVDLRWQNYFSDWVDGLNHQLNSNTNNDWLLWLNIGYVYYIDD